MTNVDVILGDNLSVLRSLPDGCVDLVYLDPPFNSSQRRVVEVTLGGPRREFDDRFSSIGEYLRWIRPRLRHSVRVLRDGGTLFAHCDWRTSHYLRVELDKLLGYESFVNELVWKRHSGNNNARQGSRHFGRVTDSILFYGKGQPRKWHAQYVEYDDDYIRTAYRHVEPETGRRYARGDLSGPGGTTKGNPVFEFMGAVRAWRYSKARMEQLLVEGRIVTPTGGGVPTRKRYLDEMPGRPLENLWTDIACLPADEIAGYPTQKPLRLLERIILSSTDPGDLVLDPFCGSGTTLVAATQLGRRALGIDSSPDAVSLARLRLETRLGVHEAEQVLKENHAYHPGVSAPA